MQQKPAGWAVSADPVNYEAAVAAMEARVDAIQRGEAGELVWLLEHPALYTAGTSADAGDLREAERFPVYRSGRGGEYTYHGPGQRVAYVMMDLRERGRDARKFVNNLEDWIIATLGQFNVKGEKRCDRIGVWVDRTQAGGTPREDKIAAIGIRLRRWVSFHGIALNVEPDLSHFGGIVPCGITNPAFGVTSLTDLGLPVTMDDADFALKQAFVEVFGAVEDEAAPV